MRYRVMADVLLVVHLAFIVFVIGGGLLVLWKKWIALLHVPALGWGAFSEFTGAICPLTPWEQALLVRSGEAGYRGDFIEHYLVPTIYPAALTPSLQIVFGFAVLAINAAVYAFVWRRERRRRPRRRHRAVPSRL